MIIGICGLIGCGKGTVGDILVEQGFVKLSFADKLKDGVGAVFGWNRAMLEGDTVESREWRETVDNFWTKETGREITPRLVLQEFGTDCMRLGFDDGIWVSLVKQELLENTNQNYVLPDVRFENEIQMLKSIGGKIWEVKRGPDPQWLIEYESTGIDPDVHPSEWRWVKGKKDAVIENNGTLRELQKKVCKQIEIGIR